MGKSASPRTRSSSRCSAPENASARWPISRPAAMSAAPPSLPARIRASSACASPTSSRPPSPAAPSSTARSSASWSSASTSPTAVSRLDKGFRKHGVSADAEVDGLKALGAVVRVPRILDHGTDFLVLEQLDLRRSGDWAALAQMLAKLHRTSGPRFGWHRDNWIGATPQLNDWRDDWATFFLECRIEPQLALARRNGFSIELSSH